MILLGQLKLKVEDVYCLQTNMQERSFDLTLSSEGIADDVLRIARTRAGEKPFTDYEILNLDRPNFRIITVHMYNPYVTKEKIVAFLSEYGEVIPGHRKLMDQLGFWTGRTQFHVLLKADADGVEGLSHPPAFFSIAADRGFLFYSRQPPFCRRCKKHGHNEGACGFVWCQDCRAFGHETRDCPFPKKCHGCGKTGHLNKDCPERKRSYAEAVNPGRRVGGEQDASEDVAMEGQLLEAAELLSQARQEQETGQEDGAPVDIYYTGSESDGQEEKKKKKAVKKKGGARRLKKAGSAFGGNGQKDGEGGRASKRVRVDEGDKGEEEVGGGLEGQDLGGVGSGEVVEETQRDSGGQAVDLVPLNLGQELELPPMVSPVHEGVDEVQGSQPAGEGTVPWGDTPMPEGEVTGLAVPDYYS